jgi:hypothetical protein
MQDPAFNSLGGSGDHGQGAGCEPVLPEPLDGAGLEVAEVDKIRAGGDGSWFGG